MTPDLNNDPVLVLVLGFAVLSMIAIALWLYERKHDGRPHTRGTAERDRVRSEVANDHHSPEDVRGARADQAHGHRVVGRRARSAVRAQHDRQPRGAGDRLALTDDELVELARFVQFHHLAHPFPEHIDRALYGEAINHLFSAAGDIIDGDRSARR